MFEPDESVAAVVPEQLKRFWSFHSQRSGEDDFTYSVGMIQEVCGSDATDSGAIWARALLLDLLARQDILPEWRIGRDWKEAVFIVAAGFPLPHGLKVFSVERFKNLLSE